MGGSHDIQVSPSDVLRLPLWLGMTKIIIVHNHLNSEEPSKEDIHWTLTLQKGAANLHQIQLIDHVIIGKSSYFSFLENGVL